MRNVELRKAPLSSWRKIALGSWNSPGDPTVYATLEIDADKIVQRQKKYSKEPKLNTAPKTPTITTIVARASALVLKKHPQINGLIRLGRIYQRKSVTLFLQAAVDQDGHDLSGVVIENADEKSIQEITQELAAKAKAIREDRDPNFKKAKSTFGAVPPFLMRWVLNAMSFLLYTLNLDLRWAGIPKDPFGSMMITSIGSIGLDEGFAPLVAYSRVPILLAVGAIRQIPVIKNEKVEVGSAFKICVSFDHRFMDGVLGSKMAKQLRWYLETDEGLDALGL